MDYTVNLIEAISVILVCWAAISGIGAWKREFIGRRKIELAEDVLATFFEVKDAIARIRSPFSSSDEGKTREQSENETKEQAELLNRGYVVVERYKEYESVFVKFNTLKYQFMARFGRDTENIFVDFNFVLNSIFNSAGRLAHHYWPRQGRVMMDKQETERHLEDMRKHENIFWDSMNDDDEIRQKLDSIQLKLESVTRECFEEPMKSYSILTRRLFLKRLSAN